MHPISRPILVRRRIPVVVGAILVLNAVIGCQKPKLGAIPVSGSVTYQGKPAKFGLVYFRPVGEKGRPCMAEVRDGHYQAHALMSQKGLAPGNYQVSVTYSEKPLLEARNGSGLPAQVAQRYQNFETSGLTLEVPEGGSAISYDIDLKD